jgi:hypothetical protein
MGRDAGDAFETNTQVLDAYNNITPGIIDPKTLEDMASFAVTVLGTYRQLPLYIDEAQYEDLDGSFKYYVPPGAVWNKPPPYWARRGNFLKSSARSSPRRCQHGLANDALNQKPVPGR